jgi:acyl-CoA reductase-like NAD-dependent aldehyde dehydrogenase
MVVESSIDRRDVHVRHGRLYIGGRWVTPAGPGTIEVVDPSTTSVLGSVPEGTAVDAAAAAAAAADAFPGWSAWTPGRRAELIAAMAGRIRDRAEDLAWLISAEVGSPIDFSRTQQVALPISVAEGVAAVLPDIAWEERVGAAQVVSEPVGVVGAITPWNYPLHQAVAKVAAALGAGCTVVLKPSELAPFSAFVLAEVLDEVGLPPGVFNLVTGYGPLAGEAIAGHPLVDMVSLTGSGAAGRRVMELAAPTAKRVALELGGKSATVLLDDADFAAVVPGAVMHAFRNSGQNCSALSRLVVPRDRIAEVEEIAVRVAESVVVGDPGDAGTQMGPLVSALHRERVLGHIRAALDAGIRLIAGGPEPPTGTPPGFFVRPTVFSPVPSGSPLAQEEVFGPVLSILGYTDEDDAVRIANDTRYGLAGAVWTQDAGRAARVARRLRHGTVWINDYHPYVPQAEWGGYKQSGTGRELGPTGLNEYREIKHIWQNVQPRPQHWFRP